MPHFNTVGIPPSPTIHDPQNNFTNSLAPSEDSKLAFHNDHYWMKWPSYGAMVEDTARESEAYELGNTCSIIGFGLLSRIRRTLACCLLSSMILPHSACLCTESVCRCIWGVMAITDGDNNEGIECCRTSKMSCAYSCTLCAEFAVLFFCCLPNLCAPEAVDHCKIPSAHKWIEEKQDQIREAES